MNCASFEQGLARLMGGDAIGVDRERLLADLRDHAGVCEACAGSVDLIDLLALPDGQRDLVEDPGEGYWSSFETRLRPRLGKAPSSSDARWWVVAAAVVLLALVAGWMLQGPGDSPETTTVADAATGPVSSVDAAEELPQSLRRSLDQASAAEVEEELAALEELGSGWGIVSEGTITYRPVQPADSRSSWIEWRGLSCVGSLQVWSS